MQKLLVCLCVGQTQGLGGGVGGQGGYLKLFTRDCSTHIAVGREEGVWGWGNDGGGRGWGRGWGQALIEVFEQNRYRYIEFGYRHAHYEMKSAKNRDFEGVSPILAGNLACYDIIIAEKHHVLIRKKSENEMCERFHLIIYARRSSHLGKLKNCLTSKFQMLFVTKLLEDLT